MTQIPTISAEDAIAAVAAGEATLIDVRTADEVRSSGTARGALHIPTARIADAINPGTTTFVAEIGAKPKTILFCAMGARSEGAAELLHEAGIKGVMNLGSFRAWVKAGGAVEAA